MAGSSSIANGMYGNHSGPVAAAASASRPIIHHRPAIKRCERIQSSSARVSSACASSSCSCSSRTSSSSSNTMSSLAMVPFSHISPWVLGGMLVVFSIGLWLLNFLFNWLQKLDQGVGALAESFMEDPVSHQKVRCPSVFDPPEKYISLVMPAYNEEERLPSTLDETLSYLQGRAKFDDKFTYEIVIVDDGSRDSTVKVANEYIKKHGLDTIRVIKQVPNAGKGAAVTKGVLCTRGELILMLDADGATRITDLEKLENAMRSFAARQKPYVSIADTLLVACGSRAHLEEKALAQRKWYRNVLTKGFHFLVVLVARTQIRDTQCGFKMFTRAAARQIYINLRLKRWCFDVELLYLCQEFRIPTMEIAVNWTEIAGSKVRITSVIHMFLELLLIRLGYNFNVWKVHKSLIRSS